MSERKQLGSISYHSDDDTGMYSVGEIDGGFDETKLEYYIKTFGKEGVSDLMNQLGYMAYQVKQKQFIVQQQLSGSAETASHKLPTATSDSCERCAKFYKGVVMACGTCGGYYHCHCDLLKMEEELRIKKTEVELLEFKIEKRKKRKLKN